MSSLSFSESGFKAPVRVHPRLFDVVVVDLMYRVVVDNHSCPSSSWSAFKSIPLPYSEDAQ